jgi:hypothetical protein
MPLVDPVAHALKLFSPSPERTFDFTNFINILLSILTVIVIIGYIVSNHVECNREQLHQLRREI